VIFTAITLCVASERVFVVVVVVLYFVIDSVRKLWVHHRKYPQVALFLSEEVYFLW
jgi:hypothetical protein